ncbi:MAG: hypothetical protein ACI8YC_000944 [Salibacteraceae bacterium]|jgi:hypothetical protein
MALRFYIYSMKKIVLVFLFILGAIVSSSAQSSFFAAAGSPDTTLSLLRVHLNWGTHVLSTDSFTYVFERGLVRFKKDGTVDRMEKFNFRFSKVITSEKSQLNALGTIEGGPNATVKVKTAFSTLSYDGTFLNTSLYNTSVGAYQVAQDFQMLEKNQKIIVGQIGDTNSKHSAWIMKTDSSNAVVWSSVAVNKNVNRFKKVFVDKAENIYAIGEIDNKTSISNMLVVKYSKEGNMLWSKGYGGYAIEELYDAIMTKDEELYLVGQSISYAPNGGITDAVLLKLDTAGNVLRANAYGGAGGELFTAILEGENGELNISGIKLPGTAECSNSDFKCQDYWFVKVDKTGSILHTSIFGRDTLYDHLYDMTYAKDGGIFICGSSDIDIYDTGRPAYHGPTLLYSDDEFQSFCSTIADIPAKEEPINFELKPGIDSIMWITDIRDSSVNVVPEDIMYDLDFKMMCNTVSVKENDNADSRILFPNPANSTFSIRGIEGVYDLVVYNLNGQKQIEQSITQNDLIDISNVPNGAYVVVLQNKEGLFIEKLVVQR